MSSHYRFLLYFLFFNRGQNQRKSLVINIAIIVFFNTTLISRDYYFTLYGDAFWKINRMKIKTHSHKTNIIIFHKRDRDENIDLFEV